MPSFRSHHNVQREQAEIIALKALAFLADDEARLARFLALTGLTPLDLRASAGSRATLQAVLEHLSGDESLLFVFAASASLEPGVIGQALEAISRPEGEGAGR
jgi:hypothetical protein